MARIVDRLPPAALQSKSRGLHPDGRGLYLQVKNGGRSWVLRYMINGKARYMGFGSFPDVSLADARKEASRCRKLLRQGIDPIEERQQRRHAARIEAAKSISFKKAAEQYISYNKAGWRNAKHATQWTRTLETYAYPVFGELPVQLIDTGLVTKVLNPIWQQKTETATRLRQRIEAVLDWAKAHQHRSGDNPARWRGHLDKLLVPPGRLRKVKPVKHFAAMPYAALPKFFGDLSNRDAVSAKAMAFLILNGGRTTETLMATVGEIDFADGIWTVPGAHTKSGRKHRVPLSKEAIALLRGLKLGEDSDALLFPNALGKPLSANAMRKYLQEDMGWGKAATPHGFRSTFKDWASERTNFSNELSETALSHMIKDKTEAAYRRGDALNKRRRMMEMWGRFCASGTSPTSNVVGIRSREQGLA